jgi:hypothetical protein
MTKIDTKKILEALMKNQEMWMFEEPKKDTLKDKLLKSLLPPEEIENLEETYAGFSNIAMPIIRAAFPNNPINNLISIQPTAHKKVKNDEEK